MTLINATTLIHKSTLSTNNFGIFILDKSIGTKIFLEISEVYNGICLKKFQRLEQKLEMRFCRNFPFFRKFRNFKKIVEF